MTQALAEIQESARHCRVYAVVGTPFWADGCLFNSAVVIGRDGEVLTRYDQISAQPDGPYTPGKSTQAMWFEIDGVYATVTIGNDLYWPELTELAAYRGMQLHLHLDCWQGESCDADLVRKHGAINHGMPAVCGAWVNAASPGASGKSLLLRRAGGHGKANPGGVEAYLPYHTSVVQTGGTEAQMLYLTAQTGKTNQWQAWRNRKRRSGRNHDNWWKWVSHGVQTIYK